MSDFNINEMKLNEMEPKYLDNIIISASAKLQDWIISLQEKLYTGYNVAGITKYNDTRPDEHSTLIQSLSEDQIDNLRSKMETLAEAVGILYRCYTDPDISKVDSISDAYSLGKWKWLYEKYDVDDMPPIAKGHYEGLEIIKSTMERIISKQYERFADDKEHPVEFNIKRSK